MRAKARTPSKIARRAAQGKRQLSAHGRFGATGVGYEAAMETRQPASSFAKKGTARRVREDARLLADGSGV